MTNIEKQKSLFREKLKNFEEGIDYTVSVEIDDAWKGKEKIYTVFSPKLKKDLKEIFPSVDNWENDENFVYKVKESTNNFSISRSLNVYESHGSENVKADSPRIQEITDQEAQQIEQQRPFFPKPKGNF